MAEFRLRTLHDDAAGLKTWPYFSGQGLPAERPRLVKESLSLKAVESWNVDIIILRTFEGSSRRVVKKTEEYLKQLRVFFVGIIKEYVTPKIIDDLSFNITSEKRICWIEHKQRSKTMTATYFWCLPSNKFVIFIELIALVLTKSIANLGWEFSSIFEFSAVFTSRNFLKRIFQPP